MQRLYDTNHKTVTEKLIEGYKKEFGDGGVSKEMRIKVQKEPKKVSDLLKLKSKDE